MESIPHSFMSWLQAVFTLKLRSRTLPLLIELDNPYLITILLFKFKILAKGRKFLTGMNAGYPKLQKLLLQLKQSS